MLVLSRKPGQSLLIGDDIEIIVNSIQGNRVSLAIKAPREINVRRNEIPVKLQIIDEIPTDQSELLSDKVSRAINRRHGWTDGG